MLIFVSEKLRIKLQFDEKWLTWTFQLQHGRYLENWYLEAGRDLGTSEADTEVGVLWIVDSGFRGRRFLIGWDF